MWRSSSAGPAKVKMPSVLRGRTRAPSARLGHTAFGSGGNRAFNDPATMVAPDQAFGAAMAQPQGGAMPAAPIMPPTEG